MRSNGLKEKTIQSYETIYRLYLGPLLGHLRLDKIGIGEIEAIKGTMKELHVDRRHSSNPRTGKQSTKPRTKGKKLQPSTINQVLHKIAAILEVAKYLGKIATVPTVRYMKEPVKEPACYTFADACAFVQPREDGLGRSRGDERQLA